jgi:uncharacterized protein YegP (UPF0339 family)
MEVSFQYFRDDNGQWRWRMRAANGKKIAECGEGYHNRQACEHGLSLVVRGARTATVIGEDGVSLGRADKLFPPLHDGM